ncbi:integral membrane sensor signal transduction histidine kinase (plasmid) [Thalassoporum mexicanum PCC 7367]|uniref:sensor histidine kinase n=1 Tax=Thalassoporum mexicanum TaxID=3457544 RepID=UPI00029F8FD6|nr:HAMP domain-containing sensor histidine kinase [Pseudanabaena sp. PCC 7367]AFY71989.1 integral membrane sensor signal transduction histidine kinase [Pseudanabaena sp. PCC 7367]
MTEGITDDSNAQHHDFSRYWYLTYRDPTTEAFYSSYAYDKIIVPLRFTTFVAIFVYLTFGILDYALSVHAGREYWDLWLIRLTTGFPILLISFFLSFSRYSRQHYQRIYSTAIWLTGCSLLWVSAVGDVYLTERYYAGLFMVFFYGSMLFFIKFTYTVFMAISLYAMYVIVALYKGIETIAMINNLFFLTGGVLLAAIAVYIHEMYSRDNFKYSQILLSAVSEANAANKAKTDFLAVMNHELRSPLVSVIGGAQALTGQLFGDWHEKRELYVNYADMIERNGQHLLTIINEILDYSKAASGQQKLREAEFIVQETIAEAVDIVTPQLEQKDLQIHTHIPITPYTLFADPQLTKQMIVNLLSNAIKFSPKQATIKITLKTSDDGLHIKVKDQGIGINKEDLERVLKPFEQVDEPYIREQSSMGTGLGLPYVALLMQMHNGAITLDSELQQGTTATLIFPTERLL